MNKKIQLGIKHLGKEELDVFCTAVPEFSEDYNFEVSSILQSSKAEQHIIAKNGKISRDLKLYRFDANVFVTFDDGDTSVEYEIDEKEHIVVSKLIETDTKYGETRTRYEERTEKKAYELKTFFQEKRLNENDYIEVNAQVISPIDREPYPPIKFYKTDNIGSLKELQALSKKILAKFSTLKLEELRVRLETSNQNNGIGIFLNVAIEKNIVVKYELQQSIFSEDLNEHVIFESFTYQNKDEGKKRTIQSKELKGTFEIPNSYYRDEKFIRAANKNLNLWITEPIKN